VPWKEWQAKLPEPDYYAPLYDAADALSVVAGEVSGNLEILDFDNFDDCYQRWLAIVTGESKSLVERLTIERTQNGGHHVIYRAPSIEANTKLAARLIPCDGPGEIAIGNKTYKPRKAGDLWVAEVGTIETRGSGGLIICVPTPGYELVQGSMSGIPRISDDERDLMLSVARSLNEVFETPQEPPRKPSISIPGELSPGDDYNARAGQSGALESILERHGWLPTQRAADGNQRWARPGKRHGTSATLKGGDFYVFSSNAPPFEAGRAYRPFAVFTLLECGGDFQLAARELRKLGYGSEPAVVNTDLMTVNGKSSVVAVEDDYPIIEEVPCDEDMFGDNNAGPFPQSALDPGGILGEIMSLTMRTCTYKQPTFALAGAIAMLSLATGRKIRYKKTYSNVYCLCLGPSGVGKGWARKINIEILNALGASALYQDKIGSGKGIISHMEREPRMMVLWDEIQTLMVGISNKSSLWFRQIEDEFKTIYSEAGNPCYKPPAVTDREKVKPVANPHLVIYGTGVPDQWWEACGPEVFSGGFLNRFLLFENMPFDADDLGEDQDISIPGELKRMLGDWFHMRVHKYGNVGDFSGTPDSMEATPEAQAAIREHRVAIVKRNANEPTMRANLWQRTAENALRLAIIKACSDACGERPTTLEAHHYAWGKSIANWSTRRMLDHASKYFARTAHESSLKRVFASIPVYHPISRSQVVRKNQWLDARQLDGILAQLVAGGQLSTTTGRKGARGPLTTYYLRTVPG
jgi:hypothetical protein